MGFRTTFRASHREICEQLLARGILHIEGLVDELDATDLGVHEDLVGAGQGADGVVVLEGGEGRH